MTSKAVVPIVEAAAFVCDLDDPGKPFEGADLLRAIDEIDGSVETRLVDQIVLNSNLAPEIRKSWLPGFFTLQGS